MDSPDYEDDEEDDEECLELIRAGEADGEHPINEACEVVVNSLGSIAWFIGALTGGLSRE